MSIPTLVAWNLENSPLPRRIDWGAGAGLEKTDIELAVLGMKKFLPTRDLELKQLFVTGWSKHRHLLENMKRIEDIDRVLCSPMVAKDGGEEADDKIVLEMTRFIGNYPNGAIVLISKDEDFSKFCQFLRRAGTPLYILVDDRKTVPVGLRNCALDVWEWKDFPHEA